MTMKYERGTLAWSLVLLVGCGGSTGAGAAESGSVGSTGGGTTPGTEAEFITAYCNLFVPCCVDAGLGTGQACSIALGALVAQKPYNATAAPACLQEMQQASTQSDFCTNGGSGPSCSNVFSGGSGTKGPGQPCSQDGDCLAPSGGMATCYLQTVFVDGGTASTGSCMQLTAGQAGQGPCFETISGNSSSSAGSSTSMPPPARGYFCDVASGVACNFTTQKCTALGIAGQACQQDQDCVAADYCQAFPTNTCAARIADGASCAASSEDPCQATSYCDSGSQTCKPRLANGVPCTVDQQCQGQMCTNGTCSGSSNTSLSIICGQ
jgi:hypothetical protein